MEYKDIERIGEYAALSILKFENSKYKDEALSIYKATDKTLILKDIEEIEKKWFNKLNGFNFDNIINEPDSSDADIKLMKIIIAS